MPIISTCRFLKSKQQLGSCEVSNEKGKKKKKHNVVLMAIRLLSTCTYEMENFTILRTRKTVFNFVKKESYTN